MPSQALTAFLEAVGEVVALQAANPSPTESRFKRPEVKRVIGRAQVVLLSSHFERYFYEVNEEVVCFLLGVPVSAGVLPAKIRLLHSRAPVDELFESNWERREIALRTFAAVEAPLWDDGRPLDAFEHGRLLEWMSTPKSKKVKRYYAQWGIEDVFSSMTRSATTRRDLWLRIDELVEKRNNIAHGDLTVEATYLDVQRYLGATRKFVRRADRVLAGAVDRLIGGPRPWS